MALTSPAQEVRCPRCLHTMQPEEGSLRVICPSCGRGHHDVNVFYVPSGADDASAQLSCARCARPLGRVEDLVQSCAACATRHVIPLAVLPQTLAERLRDPSARQALATRASRSRRTVLSVALILVAAVLLLLIAGRRGT